MAFGEVFSTSQASRRLTQHHLQAAALLYSMGLPRDVYDMAKPLSE